MAGMKPTGIVLSVLLAVVAVGMVFPMAWMLLVSLRSNPEQYANLIDLLNAPTILGNYTDALKSDKFLRYFINSALVGAVVTAGNVVFCLWSGYALARGKTRVTSVLFLTVLGVLMIPQQVLMIPMYRLMAQLHWINTYAALTIPFLVTPFGIFLVRQYILSIPTELEDAARIDGAGDWAVLWRIIFPLTRPVLTVLAIYTFLSNWNSFLYPFLFINDEAHRTLPVGLAFYIGKQSIDWGHLMAGASISALPILLLFVVFQKSIIQGLTAGALKE
ncbi:MAG: carbohydrate ABC transporter permease [Chlorobi bacterium]|nr:MAG: carbohydrate ABC transporter permease [Bacteroidota bacterium]KXK35295.1 MAG: ABC-type sugar transport system permease subunit [Chlorobi bacterium OLB6]MBE2264899.1 carbohydrate ABC transporter permease [Flavobacteriales bacterium]MBL1160797.1 carbohydrate ABC transporter permease [Chlorobiota bacterium]MBW7853148.1 carbohydrate ABC transporter permease [Candidatus Kapabacteria bacterium]MCC6331363.1 carbohydrate ABC transporter permease [Ignavibacteria bacterium]